MKNRSAFLAAALTVALLAPAATSVAAPAAAAPPPAVAAAPIVAPTAELQWILWDYQTYGSYTKCMSRANYLVRVYTDIEAIRCVFRVVPNSWPTKIGWMIEVKRK